MEYVGIQTQQSRNNLRSLLLLVFFPILVLGLVLLFCYLLLYLSGDMSYYPNPGEVVWSMFVEIAPWTLVFVIIWFLIAYFTNTSIIKNATRSRPLERKDNKRVYNLVENLCMAQGMPAPKINVIDDDSLNAFASGIDKKSYTVTLTTGIIEKLDDEELEGVIAHELSHIRNHDVRLLIVSIVFVGIFAMVAQICIRLAASGSGRNKKSGGAAVLLIAMAVALLGYLFSTLMRFAISRKREYLADAGAAEMTKKPSALASALRKISDNPEVEALKREDVAQLFIQHPKMGASGKKSAFGDIFATHPPIEKRIQVLEQF